MPYKKRLAAFDFDRTITIENTDYIAQRLLPKHILPKYESNGWTNYMKCVFELLHKEGIGKKLLTQAIVNIPPIEGMPELIKTLSEKLNYDVIIISDSNSYFIDVWLKEHKLAHNIKEIFTNPGNIIDDLLKIEMYHHQDWCKLSEKNLCKGHVLDNFISKQKDEGIYYEKVIYAGDASNDFCPMLQLGPGDLAFCRDGYKCCELVKIAKANKPIDGELYSVKADVHVWKSGFDILNTVENMS